MSPDVCGHWKPGSIQRRRQAAGEAAAGPDEVSNVVEIRSASQLQEEINKARASAKLLVVDYYTVWCGPCKKVRRQ